ncbi:TraR/DksA family transcriptional regulator [bacterium]|nr:TraR/DksA family transcriptional regulator [bacterium]
MEKRKIKYFSRQILIKRNGILTKLIGLEKDFHALQHNHPKDWAEVTNDAWERETITQKIDAEKKNLRILNSSLRKLIDGSYGVCACCGERIPEARLKALPFANLCIKCKIEEEHWAMQAG